MVFDCVCNAASVDASIGIVKKGGRILEAGVAEHKFPVDMGLVMFNELKLIGCMMYNDGDFEDAMGILAKGKIDLEGFITKVFSLSEIKAVFPEVIGHKDRYVKCVLQP